jgi:hypothetical protein
MGMGTITKTPLVGHLMLKIIIAAALSFHIIVPMKTNGSLPLFRKVMEIQKNNKS